MFLGILQQEKWWRFFDVCIVHYARVSQLSNENAFDYICRFFVDEIVANYLILINSFHFAHRAFGFEGGWLGTNGAQRRTHALLSELLLLLTIGGDIYFERGWNAASKFLILFVDFKWRNEMSEMFSDAYIQYIIHIKRRRRHSARSIRFH